MPLSQQEAEALAHLASLREGAQARCEPLDGNRWAVVVRDASGDHRIESGQDYNRWDHGSPEPVGVEVDRKEAHWSVRILGLIGGAVFGLVREIGLARRPGSSSNRHR